MRWRLRILVRFAVARAAGVLTVSRWAKDELVKAYALPSEQIFVVPNAPSIDAVRPRKPDGKTVLFVGRIEPRKNLSLLLDAFGQMHTQDRRIVVVGREDFSSADVLARLQNTPNAVHIPWASDSELADLYATSAVLAFPSSGEGFGIPVVDALNAGLPIIVSSTTAIPEVAGGFARVFNPNASDASEVLADMLDKEIKHPTTPDQDSLASHLATFDWNRSSVKLLEALRFCAH